MSSDYFTTFSAEFDCILIELHTLQEQKERYQQEIARLEAEGCVHGNIVTEWRNGNGPYYRLTFYTDPATGEKPKPVYIGTDAERRARVEQQITNHQERLGLQEAVARIGLVMGNALRRVEDLRGYLVNQNTIPFLRQLVIPAVLAANGDNTKIEG
jgi:hypothetical protein